MVLPRSGYWLRPQKRSPDRRQAGLIPSALPSGPYNRVTFGPYVRLTPRTLPFYQRAVSASRDGCGPQRPPPPLVERPARAPVRGTDRHAVGCPRDDVADHRVRHSVAVPRRFPIASPLTPRTFDITRDGKTLGVLTEGQSLSQATDQIQVVLNWFEELKRLVPPR